MLYNTKPEVLRIRKMYENSEYYKVLENYKTINENFDSFTIHEQITLNFYIVQSLIKTGSFNRITEIVSTLQNKVSLIKLNVIDNLIFLIVVITGYENTGKVDEKLFWYQKAKEFAKNNLEALANSEENYWYYYFLLVSAIVETSQRNYSISYSLLKEINKHFLNIKEKSNSDIIMLSLISTQLGKINRLTNYLDIAEENFKDAIKWSKKGHHLENTRGNYLNLSLVYEEQGRDYLAIQNCSELIQEIDNNFNHDEFSLSSAYNLLGNIYNRTGEFVLAREMYLKSLDIVSDASVIQRIKSFNFNNIGVISFKLGNFNESLNYYMQALELALSKQDPTEIGVYYSNIGEAYFELGILAEAYESELQALSYLKTIQNDELLIDTYFTIIRISLERNDLEKADDYINEISKITLKAKKRKFEYKLLFSKALKLKKEQKFFEAKEIFLAILKNQNLSLDLQTITLVELAGLVFESIINKEKCTIDQGEIIKKLDALGKQSKSVPVVCNLAILQSRLKVLDLNFESAESILDEVDEYCVARNVSYFRPKIQNELQFIKEIKQQDILDLEYIKNLLRMKMKSNNSFNSIRDLERLMLS